MRKSLLALAAIAALASAPAFAATSPSSETEVKYQAKDNGGFKAEEKSTAVDAAGTKVENKAEKSVDVDADGSKETKVQVKHSTDPKGLFNKSTTETVNKTMEKDGKVEHSHKKKIDGKTVEENTESSEKR
ncbi:MAG: hypothetical protein WAO98_07070 [Alphaproteobacteria bacterium]